MCFDSAGLSPSQMIAVWSPRLARCRSMQFAATLSTPSSNHLIEMLPGAKEDVLDLVEGLHPVDALGLFGPESLGVRDRAGVHVLVLVLVDKGALGPFRGYVVNLLGHRHSPLPAGGRGGHQPSSSLISIMRRRAGPRQGGNLSDLGLARSRPAGCAAAVTGVGFRPCWNPGRGLGAGHEDGHFRVLPQVEINVIARMGAMTGIWKPSATDSGLAKAAVTP